MLKKLSILLVFLVALLSLYSVDVEIGTGTAETYYIPVNGLWDYGWSRTVYYQSELGNAADFTSISYNVSNEPSNYIFENQQIYYKLTDATSFSETVWVDPANDDSYTLIYDANITYNGSGWKQINLDQPIQYNGTDNIEIVFVNNDADYVSNYPKFLKTDAEESRSVYKYADNEFPAVDGTLASYYPNIRFSYAAENEPTASVLVSPEDNEIDITINTTLEWETGENTDEVDVYLSSDLSLVSSMDSSALLASSITATSYQVNDLDYNTNYYWMIVSRNTTNSLTAISTIKSFRTEMPQGSVLIGTGTATGQSLPFEPYYKYTVSQTIYQQSQINVQDKRVVSLSYQYNGNSAWEEDIVIYMGTTDLTAFETTSSWVSLDNLEEVYNGVISVPDTEGWVSILLDVPFTLSNTQNLVIATESNTPVYHASSDEFFCTSVEENVSLVKFSDSVDYDFITPPEGTLKNSFANIVMEVEDLPTEPVLAVNPTSIDFGENLINTTSLNTSVTVRNNGLGVLNVNSVVLDNTDNFILTDTNTYPLELTDGTITFNVSFTADTVGDYTGNITVTDSEANEVTVALTATAVDAMIYDFPYSEGFEDITSGTLPAYWSSITNSTASLAGSSISTYSAYEGSNCLKMTNSSDAEAEVKAITRPISEINTKRVKFFARVYDPTVSLQVGTISDVNDATTFNMIQNVTLSSTYAEYIVSFTAAQAGENMICFNFVGNGDTYESIMIDNVVVENIPAGSQISVLPDSLDFGNVYLDRTAEANLEIGNWGSDDLEVSLSSDNGIFTFVPETLTVEPSQTATVVVTLHPNAEGPLSEYFTITSNDTENTEMQVLGYANILAALPEGVVVIGDETLTQNLPIEPFYGYSYSQMIYTPNEVAIEGQQIEKISFYYNGHSAFEGDEFKIYMAHTDLTEFADTDSWIDINDFMNVYTGTLTVFELEGWVEFELDIPFVYDNTHNLVIACEENTTGYHGSSDDFYSSARTEARSIVHYSDSIDADPYNPPTANATKNAIANVRLQFGQLQDAPVLSVYPAVNEFELTPVDGQSTERQITFRSIGLQDVVINEAPVLTGADASQFTISSDDNTYPLTIPFNETATINVQFTPTSDGAKTAQLSVTDNATRVVNTIDLTGYAYADDNNDTVTDATSLVIPLDGETFSIMPEGDVDWYKIPALGIQDTITIYTEMEDGSDINLKAWLYGPAASPNAVDVANPVASDDNTHGNSQPEIEFSVPASGDYYLRISQNTYGPEGARRNNQRKNINGDDLRDQRNTTGLYNLFIEAIFNYDYNAPLNVEANNQNGYVEVSWDEPPYERALVSYNVYRDDEMINTEAIPLGTNSYNDASVIIGEEYTYYVVGVYTDPNGESVPSNSSTITYFSIGDPLWGDDFEDHADFALNLNGWIQYDLDESDTYGVNDIDFPNSGSAMSFIAFNPSQTTPAMTSMETISGEKIACSFSAYEGNNDFLVSPAITVGTTSVLSFWARSYTDEYSLERFKVLLSLGGEDPDDFSYTLNDGEYVEAPNEWTFYTFNVSELAGSTIRFAINCVSEQSFIFMLDDVRFDSTSDAVPNTNNDVEVITSALRNNYPNPFNPETTISYDLKEQGKVSIDIFNIKGQKVKTLVDANQESGNHNVVWNGRDDNNKKVSSGVYFYKMKTDNYSATKKMILMK